MQAHTMYKCTVSKQHQVKKTKVLRCRRDTTECRIRCPKCERNQKSHSKLFKNPQNLWRHLWQSHSTDKNDYPSNDLTVQVLEEITTALHNDDPLDTIPQAVSWSMIIK